jgi:hypothetical protein
MIENEPEKPKKGWGCLQWGVVVVTVFFVASFFVPSYGLVTEKALQMKGGSNARQIVGLLLAYASDHHGHYPDHGKDLSKLSSNEAFRSLVSEELVLDEMIFSCPESRFVPDKNIGVPPDYSEALQPGENHWMFVAGLSNTSTSHYPLVIEDAAYAAWPSTWLPYAKPYFSFSDQRRLPGMAWKDGKIIVAFNDASVQTVKLELRNGLLHLPESFLKPPGKEPLPDLKVLDVEEVAR